MEGRTAFIGRKDAILSSNIIVGDWPLSLLSRIVFYYGYNLCSSYYPCGFCTTSLFFLAKSNVLKTDI